MGKTTSARKEATGSAATKKQRCMETAGGGKVNLSQAEEEETNDVFRHDVDTLHCDICSMPFDCEVYPCKNGHAACGDCCVRLHRKCPSCNESIGDIRCRAMEKILAGMTRPCKFKKHGCKQVLKCTGPIPAPSTAAPTSAGTSAATCWTRHGPFFYTDFSGHVIVTLDKSTRFCVLLHPDRPSMFLLLNGGDVPTGRSLSVVRICRRPAPRYTIAMKGSQPGSLWLTASGILPFMRRLEGYKPQEFLFVPDACWGSSQTVTVDVTVNL